MTTHKPNKKVSTGVVSWLREAGKLVFHIPFIVAIGLVAVLLLLPLLLVGKGRESVQNLFSKWRKPKDSEKK